MKKSPPCFPEIKKKNEVTKQDGSKILYVFKHNGMCI